MFDSRTRFFLENSSLLGVGEGEDIKLITELFEKVQHFRNQAIKNG